MCDPNYTATPKGRGYAKDCDDIRRETPSPKCAACGKRLHLPFYVLHDKPLCDPCYDEMVALEAVCR